MVDTNQLRGTQCRKRNLVAAGLLDGSPYQKKVKTDANKMLSNQIDADVHDMLSGMIEAENDKEITETLKLMREKKAENKINRRDWVERRRCYLSRYNSLGGHM
ncbi:hypothetical protein BOTCAL_0105g00320 [Botryotinia calthae]|uniref:Uncharacterized protein n=1 Tax=Botryotinia calthae TaxID=38488 RepID=A0A4Y8D5T8_9HELO|nr:hypothetical protein BOTCAL_0105g00320 [Botryotinia calthae]